MGDILNPKVDVFFICAIVFISIMYTFPRWADPNQNSRLDTIVAVIEDGSFQIDRFVWNTVDYAKVGDHYYSDKAPGIAWLGIPIYAGLNRLLDIPAIGSLTTYLAQSATFQTTLREEGTGVSLDKVRFAITQVTLVAILAAIPTAGITGLIFLYLERFDPSRYSRTIVALGYGLLTPAWTYGGALYGHQLSAFLLFGCFYGISKGWFERSLKHAFSLGFILAYAVVTEYPSLLAAAVIALFAAYRFYNHRAGGKIVAAAIGGLIPLIALMMYNNYLFGNPFDLGYAYSELWQDQHLSGFMSLQALRLEALGGILFGSFRGLFILSPWLLASVAGFVFWWRKRVERLAFWICLIASLSFLAFNASSVMWWGGFSVGPRYLLPALPFLSLPAIFSINALKQGTPFRWLMYISLFLSFLATWGLSLAGQSYPSDIIQNPFTGYAIPAWEAGDVARNLGHLMNLRGAMSLVPLMLILVGLLLGWGIWVKKHASRDRHNRSIA